MPDADGPGEFSGGPKERGSWEASQSCPSRGLLQQLSCFV